MSHVCCILFPSISGHFIWTTANPCDMECNMLCERSSPQPKFSSTINAISITDVTIQFRTKNAPIKG